MAGGVCCPIGPTNSRQRFRPSEKRRRATPIPKRRGRPCCGNMVATSIWTTSWNWGKAPNRSTAFSFASLRRLAEFDGLADYPIKVGYTAREIGAIARVRGLMYEAAAFPERPQLLLVFGTANGRALETAILRELRAEGRKLKGSPSPEWFRSTREQIAALCQAAGG